MVRVTSAEGLAPPGGCGERRPTPRARHCAQLPAWCESGRDRVGDSTGRFLMSITVRIHPRNMTRQQYDTVRDALIGAGDWPADGCQLHVLFGEENDLRVSEVWESRAKLDAFGDKLRPRIQAAGIQLSGEPEVFETHL